MFKIRVLGVLALGVGLGAFAADAAAQAGPDLVIGEIDAVQRWGTRDGLVAYSVGTVVCNSGTALAAWDRFTPAHPVIAGDLFRLKDGRFEQIGVSWVKHTFFADIASLCGVCQIPAGYNGTQLGVGCADAYSASINGEVWTQGPRSQINGFTGIFPFPADLSGFPAATPTIGRRIQVAVADVDPSQNPGARYFADSQYVAADEASFGNGANSASYREFTVAPGTFNWTAISATRRTLPAVYAWQEADPSVRIEPVEIPGEGTLLLASRVAPAAGGLWRYTYALQNINSDLAVAGLSLPLSPCAGAPAAACSLPRHHSGEPWANTPWPFTRDGAVVSWATPETYGANPNTSALRWATLASFELVTDRPPRVGPATLTLFKPGAPGPLSALALVPGGSADFNGDGFLDFFDYDDFVGGFEVGDPAADFNGDGFLDFFDYDDFVGAFEAGC